MALSQLFRSTAPKTSVGGLESDHPDNERLAQAAIASDSLRAKALFDREEEEERRASSSEFDNGFDAYDRAELTYQHMLGEEAGRPHPNEGLR